MSIHLQVFVKQRKQKERSYMTTSKKVINSTKNMIYKKSHPPNNKPRPRFASPAVLDNTAAPVEAATLLVALAALDVADPEL
jgi:hypothetical protein